LKKKYDALYNTTNVLLTLITNLFSRWNTYVKTIKNAVLDLPRHRKDDNGIEWMAKEKK
jgi:hypothetical protein